MQKTELLTEFLEFVDKNGLPIAEYKEHLVATFLEQYGKHCQHPSYKDQIDMCYQAEIEGCECCNHYITEGAK